MPVILFLLSIGLQLAAAVYALLLIRITGRRLAWILLSLAMVLMAWRRIVSFSSFLIEGKAITFDLPEVIALIISALMLAGVLRIGTYFRSIRIAEKEREQAEEALKENEAKFRSLSEESLAGIVIIQDGRFKYLNPAMAGMLGYSREEMLGAATILELVADEDRALVKENLLRRQSGEVQTIRYVFRAQKKDGSLAYLEVLGSCVPFEGRPAVMSTVLDITERKLAEEKLRESEESFKAIFDSAMDGILIADVKTLKFLTGNNAICRMLGYSSEEISTLGVTDIHTEKDMPYVMEQFEKLARRELVTANDIPVKRKDGSIFYAEINSSSLTLKGRAYLIGIFRDITERKKSEELIRNILESVDEGFIIIDRDFRIISANRAFANEVKMPVEDVIGKHCYKVSHHLSNPCYEEGEDCAVKRVFETGEPHAVVHTHFDAKGNHIYIETKAYPLSRDESGKVMTVIEILVDITEKRKLEEQLRHMQKMEAIGQLAGGIAHDFNNILTAIVGYGHVALMKMAADDPQRLNIEHMLEAADKAARLTQNLLVLSRKQIIDKKPVDLNEIIRTVEKLLLRIIGENIKVETILHKGAVDVLADSGQIEQVLMNLATNARDAIQECGTFTIETEVVELDDEFAKIYGYGKPGIYALMTVTDSGAGMDEATRERIFEPFFTTKEFGKGTGLGLSIVYGIIKQHDGYINCYSEINRGTTFRIYLPVFKTEAVKEAKPAEAAGIPLSRGTETILLAEDEKSVRRLISDVLKESGYKVIEAVDGEEAVSKFMENKDRIDLLLLDVVMPKMSGREAYEIIKKVKPDIKLLMTSGYSADFISTKGIIEEGLNFLAKPMSPVNLLKKVRETLDT
ncbi:MAG: PAS domain S-box protein [Nitrospiraceae bacterium]|nr:MAG: PAS domain S-box protein [Nitrospiraceae bacterium]